MVAPDFGRACTKVTIDMLGTREKTQLVLISQVRSWILALDKRVSGHYKTEDPLVVSVAL